MKGQATHGIFIGRMSRNNPDWDGRGHCTAEATPNRDTMFAQVHIVTDTFRFPATIELTAAEVKVINNLEAKIAARLSDAVANKGVHAE